MAQTDAAVFVPMAALRLQRIKQLEAQIQEEASTLYNDWNGLSKTSMSGWGTLDFTKYAFAATDLAAALNDLNASHNGVTLTTIYTQYPLLLLIIV